MYRIAIVEDEATSMEWLRSCLDRYSKDEGIDFGIACYSNAVRFLDTYKGEPDLVFMDIDMPAINGMEAARHLREIDSSVALVFVTNLAKFAVNGYEVDALDFIVKPVEYKVFAIKMNRIMRFIRREAKVMTLVRTSDGVKAVRLSSILYVEVLGHYLYFHTDEGILKARGSLCDIKKELEGASFALCNKSYLVNLARVKSLDKLTVVVGDEEIQVSRLRRSEFLKALSEFYSGRKINH